MARVYQKSLSSKIKPPPSRRHRRIKLVPRGCFGQLVMTLLIIIIGIGAVIARTGLFVIPILSPLFYRPAEPIRKIQLDKSEVKTVGPALSDMLEQYRSEGRHDLPLSEENLTKLLNVALVDGDNPSLRSIQAVIEPGGIEISGQLKSARRPYHFFITVWPKTTKGEISFTVRRASLERLSLPASFGNAIVHNYLASSEEALNDTLAKYLTISKIDLYSRTAIITGQVLQAQLPF